MNAIGRTYREVLKDKIAAQEISCNRLRSSRGIGPVQSSMLMRAERNLDDLKIMLAHFEAKASK